MAEKQDLADINVWGGKNSEKTRIGGLQLLLNYSKPSSLRGAPVRWDHDFTINASPSGKLSNVKNPSSLIPHIFGTDTDEISSQELYDDVNQFDNDQLSVEMVEGPDYTVYKITGQVKSSMHKLTFGLVRYVAESIQLISNLFLLALISLPVMLASLPIINLFSLLYKTFFDGDSFLTWFMSGEYTAFHIMVFLLLMTLGLVVSGLIICKLKYPPFPKIREIIENNVISEGIISGICKNHFVTVDFDEIMKRLTAAGASSQKRVIPIEVPGGPPLVEEEYLSRQRYDYSDEMKEKDHKLATSRMVFSILWSIVGVILFGGVSYLLATQVFATRYQDVSPLAEDTFITIKGNYVVYSINNRMTTFKFADKIEDVGYDTTYNMWLADGEDVTDKIIVSRMTDANGDIVYDIRNRIVDTDPEPAGYNFINSNPFEFDNSSSWAESGELDKGQAERISLQGRVIERNRKYLFLLGKTYAVLGTASDTETPFYELLQDDLSYAAVLFSLKAKRPINIYGQIQKTLTDREGRNSVDRLIFNFKVDYARKR